MCSLSSFLSSSLPVTAVVSVTSVAGYAQPPAESRGGGEDASFLVRLTLGATSRLVGLGEEVDLFVSDATQTLEVWCAVASSAITPGGCELGTTRVALKGLISTAHNGGAKSTATEPLVDGNGATRNGIEVTLETAFSLTAVENQTVHALREKIIRRREEAAALAKDARSDAGALQRLHTVVGRAGLFRARARETKTAGAGGGAH